LADVGAPVGIRNGTQVLTNRQSDMALVMERLDRIPILQGGTQGNPTPWASDRDALIVELAAAITVFQAAQIATGRLKLRQPDGAVDPRGKTSALLRELAGPDPLSASVVFSETVAGEPMLGIAPASVGGMNRMSSTSASGSYQRAIVHVPGCDIGYFGVLFASSAGAGIIDHEPCLFFTPTPWQGGHLDHTYERFPDASWRDLWDKYTDIIGQQMVGAGAKSILVIPFYKNVQATSLGSFYADWRQVVDLVITATIDRMDPTALRSTYSLRSVSTSSFSNGIFTQRDFQTKGEGVGDLTNKIFDFDGTAAQSMWRPTKGVIYINQRVPGGSNPAGNLWYVGGRFPEDFIRATPDATDHNRCPFLAQHAFQLFGPR
jgi:hypothetical protein